ncbi:MAG TPA: ABC transporter substrate-binding protein [Acidimicrobiales bacterium]|nr:ABC transporter substrate-binding protein [Acidimicrobiales bacterium]
MIEVVGPWSGIEQQRFGRVLQRYEQQTGARVAYIPAPDGVAAAIDARRAQSQPTDVAFLPQPGLMRQYARAGRLVPLDHATADELARNYSRTWRDLGTVDGRLYGVWFKAANKSLVWYNISAFERLGVVPPTTVDGLLRLAGRLSAAGITPFAVGAAQAWTLTDWFENLYLALEGPSRYRLLAEHRIPWTDGSVERTLQMLAQMLQPGYLAGGVRGTLGSDFITSVGDTFAVPPRAAMVSEGDFVAGIITGNTPARLGVDADVFRFPSAHASSTAVIGGGDAAVLMSHSSAAASLIRYLATPEAGSVWAALGGFISPNLNVDPAVYPDEITRSVALAVLDAGDSFLFDLSDLQPARFGSTPGEGLFGELQDFLVHRDVSLTAARLEAEAATAYGS